MFLGYTNASYMWTTQKAALPELNIYTMYSCNETFNRNTKFKKTTEPNLSIVPRNVSNVYVFSQNQFQ